LDIADGLKQLLFEKHFDLNFLLKSDAATLAQELGIEKYVAQIIIEAARKATTEYFLSS
jgi:chaperonin GroEL (HSP60 family)